MFHGYVSFTFFFCYTLQLMAMQMILINKNTNEVFPSEAANYCFVKCNLTFMCKFI